MLRVSTPRRLLDRSAVRLIAATLLSVSAGCASVDTAVVAKPGAEFSLALGQTATLSGSDYRITFNRVAEDSRCPVDVTCVWAGNAKIELSVSQNGTPADTRVLSLTPPDTEIVVGDFKIRFVSLAPAARQSEPPASRAYIARLVLSR